MVHNGIIENHEGLQTELVARGHRFASETDTDVVGHLVDGGFDERLPVPDTAPELTGVLGNLQLFAYCVADTLDRAIDRPRNLARSVTVE